MHSAAFGLIFEVNWAGVGGGLPQGVRKSTYQGLFSYGKAVWTFQYVPSMGESI